MYLHLYLQPGVQPGTQRAGGRVCKMNTQWTLGVTDHRACGASLQRALQARSHTRLLFARGAGPACPAHFLLEATGGAAPAPPRPGTKGLSSHTSPRHSSARTTPRQRLAGRRVREGAVPRLWAAAEGDGAHSPSVRHSPGGAHGRSGAWALHAVSPMPVPRPRESRLVQPGPRRGQCSPGTSPAWPPPPLHLTHAHASTQHTCPHTHTHPCTHIHTCTHVHARTHSHGVHAQALACGLHGSP